MLQVFVNVGVVDVRPLLGGVGDVSTVAMHLLGAAAVRVRTHRFQRPALRCQQWLKIHSHELVKFLVGI